MRHRCTAHPLMRGHSDRVQVPRVHDCCQPSAHCILNDADYRSAGPFLNYIIIIFDFPYRCVLCSTMFGRNTESKLRAASLAGIFAGILLACSASSSYATRGRNSATNTAFVKNNVCGQQFSGSPGAGMEPLLEDGEPMTLVTQFQFCGPRCSDIPGCTVYTSVDAMKGVRSISTFLLS